MCTLRRFDHISPYETILLNVILNTDTCYSFEQPGYIYDNIDFVHSARTYNIVVWFRFVYANRGVFRTLL